MTRPPGALASGTQGSRRIAPSLVSSDELIGNVIQVIAEDLRLRADSQNIVTDPLNQPNVPIQSAMARPISSGESS